MIDLAGKTLGPYTIKQTLGQGGMGTVYLAHQPAMDRDVAIKILPVLLAQDSSYLERFRREAKMIAKLEHVRILPVHDYGEQDGISYIVMRYLKAGTLAERIRSDKMPLLEIVHIIRQVAQGLDYAHTKGVIHRDVKPANIMLDHNGDVYVTDFGLSRLVEDSAQLTGSSIMGTPQYMSPEQGMDSKVDHRSDLYSLGVVLFEMLTGKVPFSGSSGMVIIVKHINEVFPDPSAIAPDIPQAVADVVLKATAKDPDQRYQSCTEMADALDAAAAGQIKARPRRSPANRWLIPSAVGGVVIIGIAALVLLSGTFGASPFTPTPTPTPTATASPTQPVPPGQLPPPAGSQLSPEDMKPILEVEQGLIECAGDTQPKLAFDFRPDRADGAKVFAGEYSGAAVNGDTLTFAAIPFQAPGVSLRVGPPLNDTDVLTRVAWKAGPGGIRLFIRSNPSGEMSYSGAVDPGRNLIVLHDGATNLTQQDVPADLFDGQLHTLRLTLINDNLSFAIDDAAPLTWQVTSRVPPGIVLVHAGGSPVELDMIAVCGSS